ncbi:MarR family transcriptional regulator [Bacillus cereus group sp. N6]|uniref:MarR family transcriptional regulator n=1 Tax=Bacillus cereus group sp. N6 TaxID=2794583 RepID=UPI0018F5388A|nr:helix-turn-helix domain-containing protein [Bacillus cereus group sp. N6]MBJ8113480.1 MarR family transcriptional regulator [Bacillus cereus group sp. N6]
MENKFYEHDGLSSHSLLLLYAIYYKGGKLEVSLSDLMKILKMSRPTVTKAIKEAEENRFIDVERFPNSRQPSIYRLKK